MPKDANRVSEVSTTTGTGNMTLAGAIGNHQTFGTAYGTSGNTECQVTIQNEDVDDEWEVVIATFLGASNVIQRDLVLSGSAGASKVNFSAGTKLIYVSRPAESTIVARAPRATDVVLELRGASGQTAAVLQTYNGSGAAAMQIDSAGNVRLAANTTEMLRMPQNETGAFVAVRKDLLGSPGVPGVRYRWSGTGGTIGLLQLSEGDSAYMTARPDLGILDWTNAAGTTTGVKFTRGVRFDGTAALIGGNVAGILSFDCAGGSANTAWDITPVNNTGSGTHDVRVGRRSGASTTVRFIVTEPNTANARVLLDSRGVIDVADYYIGALHDGTPSSAYISAKNTLGFNLRSGLGTAANAHVLFRANESTVIARIDADGTATVDGNTIITREKGDARFAAISSLRFKEQITPRDDLAAIFPLLRPIGFTWGGELSESDERFGMAGVSFIAEDVEPVFPEAARYVRLDDGTLVLQSLDPLAIAAVLHAKIAEQESRIAALEARPKARRN